MTETPVAKPLLASDALMEDLAPVEPARAAARLWCALVGLGLIASGGIAPFEGTHDVVAWTLPSVILGGIALVAAVAPVTYKQRAIAMIALGVLCAVLGLRGIGPARGIAVGGEVWGAFRFLAASTLPAALLFRARYRAYRRARWLLGGAFLVSLPFLARAAALLLEEELGLSHVGAAIGAIAMLASLAGFMGSETTGAGSYTAVGVVVSLAAELGLEALTRTSSAGMLAQIESVLAATLAFFVATSLTSIGLFQLLAWRFAPDARRIDLRTSRFREPPPEGGGPSDGDWSSRG